VVFHYEVFIIKKKRDFMARRTLHHLDERICKRVIYYGAKKGIESISTKRIASDLHISEPTIYVHFKNKDVLLLTCYQNITDSLNRLLAKNLYGPYKSKKEELLQDINKIYHFLFEDIFSHREETIFLFAYRRYSLVPFETPLVTSLIDFVGSFDPEWAHLLAKELLGKNNFLLLAPLEIYAYEIAKGKIPLNEKTIAYMQKTLFCSFSKASLASLSLE
jgi:AcrR family transcriptional regulator